MKKLLLVLLAVLFIGFSSCKKDELEVITPQEQVEETPEVSLIGKWLLIDGQMFFTNLETNEKTVYNHFGPGRTVSSLRYSGIIFEIEEIEQFVTVWEFGEPKSIPGYADFYLNYDYEHPLAVYITRDSRRIVEHPLTTNPEDMQLGGSARPFNDYVIDDHTIMIQIQEGYETINGYNYVYFSELKFEKIVD